MSSQPSIVSTMESHSSLFEKLPAELRLRLDQAIVDREPAGYRVVYARFELTKHDVSFTAFYYYARRLRAQTDMLHVADLAGLDGLDVTGALPTLMAYRVFEAANDEDTSPLVLQRLVNAWRTAVNTHLALQRHETAAAEARHQAHEQQAAGPGRIPDQAGPVRRVKRAIAAQAIPATIKLAEVAERSGTPRAAPGPAARLSAPGPIRNNQCGLTLSAEPGVVNDESNKGRLSAQTEVQATKPTRFTVRESLPSTTPPAGSPPSQKQKGSPGERRAGEQMTPVKTRAGSGAVPAPLFKRVQAGSRGPVAVLSRASIQADSSCPGWRMPYRGLRRPVPGAFVQASSSRFKQAGCPRPPALRIGPQPHAR